MRSKKILILALLAAVMAALLAWKLFRRDDFLYAGTIEATEVDISPRLSSVIASFDAKEGQRLRAGDPMVRLSCEDVKLAADIAERDFKKVKEKMLALYTNMGQPFMYVTDGNYQNKGELLLWHKHQGIDLDVKWAHETMSALYDLWRRPVNVETEVDGQKKVMTFAAGEFSEK